MPRKERKEKRFQFERLESRLMLAGDVHAAVVNGNLQITGDAAANGVLVAQVDETTFLVRGLKAGGEATTIDGKPRRVFHNVTGNVVINTGRGADRINVGRASKGSVLAKRLIIDAGKGNDRVVCTNVVIKGAVTIELGQGADLLSMNKVKARRAVEVKGGTNADRLVVNSSVFNKQVRIKTGAGRDKLFVTRTRARRLVTILGKHNDLMTADRTFVHYAYIHGGPGTDTLRVTRSDSDTEPDLFSIENFIGPS